MKVDPTTRKECMHHRLDREYDRPSRWKRRKLHRAIRHAVKIGLGAFKA